MEKSRLGNRIVMALMIVTLVFSTIHVSSNKRTQKQMHTEYMQLLCTERAKTLDATLAEFEVAGDSLAKNMMSALENPYGMKYTEEREEYLDLVRPMMESAYAQLPYITSVYMHFNPLLVDGKTGLSMRYDEKSGKLKEGSVINLDAYSPDEIEYVGWYYATLEMGKPIWMESYQRENLDEYTISYLIPLYRDDAVVGVLGLDMPIREIFDAMNQLGLQDGMKVYLTDKSGNLLLADNNSKIEGMEYTCSLRNDMSLVLVEPEMKLQGGWYQTILILLYVIVLLFLIGSIVHARVEKTRGFSDTGRHIMLVRFGLRVALCVVVVIVGACSVYWFGEIESAPRVKIKADNQSQETIRVVGDADMAPYSYKEKNGTVTGHEIEVVNELANRMGVNVEYKLMSYRDAYAAVKAGEADLLVGFESVTEDTDMSASTYIADDSYVVYGKETVQGVVDLYGKQMAVIAGNEPLDIYGIAKKSVEYASYEEALKAVSKGDCDYVIGRESVIRELLQQKKYDLIQVFDLMDSKVALGTLSKNKELKSRVEYTIGQMRRDGTLDRLQQKWINRVNGKQGITDIFSAHLLFYIISFVMLMICITGLVISHVKRLDEQTKAELKQKSEIDHLTQIYNRQAGEERIQELLKEKKPGMFCLLDIDKFKSINDRFGHSVGDLVLAEMAECLQRAYKDPAVIMRFGGDEFAFYIPDVYDEEQGREWVGRLFDYVDAIMIRELHERRIEISVGAYLYDGQTDVDFMDMYKYADVALYESKEAIGNYVTF